MSDFYVDTLCRLLAEGVLRREMKLRLAERNTYYSGSYSLTSPKQRTYQERKQTHPI